MNRYEYDGPVEEFGRCIASRWSATTMAPSEAKARSNLTYQFKQRYNKAPFTKIALPGEIKLLGGNEKIS